MKILKLFEEFTEEFDVDTEIEKEYKMIQDLLDEKNIRFQVDKYNVIAMDNYIVFLDTDWANEIREKHLSKNLPIGSIFYSEINLKKLILTILKEEKPTSIIGKIYKWSGIITDEVIGIDNIKKTNNFKKLKMMKDYKISPTESIKVLYEDGRKTRHINIVAEEIGKVKGVPLLNIVTAFPGNTGLEIDDRNEFSSFGYYFTSKSDIVKKMYDIE